MKVVHTECTEDVTERGLHGEALDAVFEADGVEIHEQAEAATTEAEIGEDLGFVDFGEGVDGFDFENEGFVDDEIGFEGGIEADVAVDEGDGGLAFEGDSGVGEFAGEAGFIGGFEQAGAELAVDFYG